MIIEKKKLFLCSLLFLFSIFQIFSEHKFTNKNTRKIKQTNIKSYLPVKQSHSGPLFFTMKYQENSVVKKYLKIYSQESGIKWLNRTLKNASPYMDYIKERIRYYNVPEELIYLPIVESAYNSNAVSRSGAVGLWQFMMNSIGPYDMKVNQWVDERRDFQKATNGALKKLKYNYNKLGDWYLALAAYNCGLGKVQRTIKKSGIRDFWGLVDKGLLRRETAEYVPKLLAISKTAKFKGRHGLEHNWNKPVLWKTINLDYPIDINILSKESKIPLKILKKANAELNYNITPLRKEGYKLKINKTYYKQLKATIDSKGKKLIKYDIYTIKSGDTIYMLSKHYGIPVNTIKKYNKKIQYNNLKIGDNLIIPNLKYVKKYQGIQSPNINFKGIYHVEKGDTLWSIARKHETSPEMIAYHNNISINDIINYGITLKVPKAD